MSKPRLRKRQSARRRRPLSRPLLIEAMEGRMLLTTLVVNTTSDSNNPADPTLSLREAIEISNGTLPVSALSPTAQMQVFTSIAPEEIDVDAAGVISPTTPLPTITQPVILTGYGAPGAAPNPSDQLDVDKATLTVRIDGSKINSTADGLTIDAANCVVSGLAITNFKGNGISIIGADSQGNFLWGNFIGTLTNPTTGRDFQTGLGNIQSGILVQSSNNRIGGDNPGLRNIVFGNGVGVTISSTNGTGNLLQGNFILDNSQQGVMIASSNNTIGEALTNGGNVISGNGAQGVEITGGPTAQGNQLLGNLIGTDLGSGSGNSTVPKGLNPLPNGADGILIANSPNNTIGGPTDPARNVIGASHLNGIEIEGAASTGNRLYNNWVGFNIVNNLESLDIFNVLDGILVTAPGNIIGGGTAALTNTVGLNHQHGIELSGAGASGNLIQGNIIGLNPGGGSDFGNTLDGIHIDNAPNNVVGGTTSGDVNVVSGNNNGVVIVNAGATGNILQGNFIGTGSDGLTDIGNSVDGVVIDGAPRNTIGGTASGAGNVISGNNNGVRISNLGAQGNVIQGNFIGTDLQAKAVIHNKIDGVLVDAGASNNSIGGADPASGNTIENNIGNGVAILSGTNNSILSNHIDANNQIGINLVGGTEDPFGVTANTPGGPHTGPNNLQNYPVLTAVAPAGSVTSIQGTFNSTPNTAFTIQFFSSPSADPSGFGQGRTLIGQAQVTTDNNGNAAIATNVPVLVASGQFVTATATDPSGNTSEFSNALPSVPVSIEFGAPTYTVNEHGQNSATITLTRSGGSGGAVAVNFATSNGTATAGTNYGPIAGPVFFNPGETSKTVTIPIIDAQVVGGTSTVNLTLSNPSGGATLGTPSTATLTIVNNDVAGIQFDMAHSSVNENAGTATITVDRNTGSGTATVAYATFDGSGVAGTNYTPVSGTLTFNPGQTSATFAVPILDDNLLNGNTTINLALSNPNGAVLGTQATSVLTIVESDMPGAFQFEAASSTVSSSSGTATLTVDRVGGQGGQVSVAYSTGGGTATPGTDYTPVSGTLIFNPGETSKTINIPIHTNSQAQSNKTLNVTLSSPTGSASLGTPSTTTLTIQEPATNGGGNGQGQGQGQPGPVVQNIRLVVGPSGVTGVLLIFNEPLDPSRATDLGSYGYSVLSAGPDGYFATSDDSTINLSSASYDPTTSSVLLSLARPIPLNAFGEIFIDGSTGPKQGLTDTSGNLLQGSDGVNGDPYTFIFGAGPKFLYSDADGDIVALHLVGGGMMQLIRNPSGEAEQLRIVGPVAGHSALYGHLKSPPTGNGFTSIPSLQGTKGVALHLKSNILVGRPEPVIGGPHRTTHARFAKRP